MNKALRVSLPIVFTILILFGPACMINFSALVQWRFCMVVLATIVIFASQPPLTKADLFNPTDKYSMLGISVMAVLVTNLSAMEWAAGMNAHRFPKLVDVAGFCLIWGGLALRIYAIVSLNRYFSNPVKIQSDHQLIDTGIYGFIRHPSYTGAIMTILGTILWLHAFASLPFSILLIALAYYHRISQEESLLTVHFGDEYKAYRAKTGSLVPRIKFFREK
nr:isoprenylcysteine carboxylmethyltransferase family protein [uncultured Dyadobacter sp.]